MSDKITTLHLKNDPSTNIYPNVKIENIPLDVTIAQGGANLANSGTIYEFTTSNFLSLNGGTMKGNIYTGGFGSPEEVVLGNGLDVSDLSSPSEPVTHYGSGYIKQDDDEDSSIKYEYNFPKKSGTFALKEDYPTYTDINNFTCRNENFVMNSASGYAELKNNLLVINAIIKGTSDSTGQIYFDFTLSEALGTLIKPLVSNYVSSVSGRVFTADSGGANTSVFLIKNSNTSFTFRFNDSYSMNALYSVIISVLLW